MTEQHAVILWNRRYCGHQLEWLLCRFMVANNFLQDVASSPLVFPSEGAAGGAAKPALPPVEEILDVEDSDDEGMGEGMAEGTEEGMDTAPRQDDTSAAPGGDDVAAAVEQSAGDVGQPGGDAAMGVGVQPAGSADQQPSDSVDMVVEAALP